MKVPIKVQLRMLANLVNGNMAKMDNMMNAVIVNQYWNVQQIEKVSPASQDQVSCIMTRFACLEKLDQNKILFTQSK